MRTIGGPGVLFGLLAGLAALTDAARAEQPTVPEAILRRTFDHELELTLADDLSAWRGDHLVSARNEFLVESLAQYSRDMAVGAFLGEARFQENLGDYRRISLECLPRHPEATIARDGAEKDLPAHVLLVYTPGPAILHELRSRVGEETVYAILRAYERKFRFQNPDLEDFIAVCESVSKNDLKEFFRTHLFEPGLPLETRRSWEKALGGR